VEIKLHLKGAEASQFPGQGKRTELEPRNDVTRLDRATAPLTSAPASSVTSPALAEAGMDKKRSSRRAGNGPSGARTVLFMSAGN
jgi:hypothetical protein